MANTAELLVKEAEGILEQNVLVPIILQKCASRGYVPSNDQEKEVILKVASDIRAKINAGELAPVPMSQLEEDGKLSKAASVKLANDPLAFGDELNVNMDEVEAHVKEAAAVVTWATLEALQEGAK
jgi:uncharacterized protein YqfA (UPF0365 family)